MGGPRRLRRIRITRPTALLSAVATLFAILVICAGPDQAHPLNGGGATVAASLKNVTGVTSLATEPTAQARYSCPYDDGDCRLFPRLSPAVLTVPPPTAPLAAAAQLPRPGPPPSGGRVAGPEAVARAPDLHVLQVLRT
ncbi:hypothetical protein [Streptomyces sp. NPDC088725]|uniref:hypothetical protein n=1 Tax=Streptomyces sp. NPDC088725 TaxID=3365873 RepID=UPI003821082F